MSAQTDNHNDSILQTEVRSPVIGDAATNMTPLPQPAGPTPTQKILGDLPDFKMYKETVIVEMNPSVNRRLAGWASIIQSVKERISRRGRCSRR
jgi:hypothetical protein